MHELKSEFLITIWNTQEILQLMNYQNVTSYMDLHTSCNENSVFVPLKLRNANITFESITKQALRNIYYTDVYYVLLLACGAKQLDIELMIESKNPHGWAPAEFAALIPVNFM